MSAISGYAGNEAFVQLDISSKEWGSRLKVGRALNSEVIQLPSTRYITYGKSNHFSSKKQVETGLACAVEKEMTTS